MEYKIEKLESDIAGAKRFNKALKKAKKTSKYGWCLRVRDPKEFAGQQLFVIFDSSRKHIIAGAAVLDGVLMASLFKNFKLAQKYGVREVMTPFMREMQKAGGKIGLCREPLLRLYKRYGLVPVACASSSPADIYCIYYTEGKPRQIKQFQDYYEAKEYLIGLAETPY